jgi:hypothetical protein
MDRSEATCLKRGKATNLLGFRFLVWVGTANPIRWRAVSFQDFEIQGFRP